MITGGVSSVGRKQPHLFTFLWFEGEMVHCVEFIMKNVIKIEN